MNLEKINFLGFEIDSHNIRIKKDNVEKFKNNFKTDLEKYILKLENKNLYPVLDRRLYHPHKTLEKVIYFTRYKVYGNLAFEMNTCNGEIKASEFLICKKCGGKKNYRGWLTYFSLITDIEQLKEIDIWIRKQIYKEFYRSTKKFTNGKPIRLKKAMLKKMNVPSLEKFYYNIKNLNFKNKKVCECNELQDEYNQSNNEHDIILYDMNSSFLSYLECNNISPLS